MTEQAQVSPARLAPTLRLDSLRRALGEAGAQRRALLYAAAVLSIITLLVIAFAPIAGLIEQWSRRDVELRSRLVFNTVRDQLVSDLEQSRGTEIARMFERLAGDDRLIALAYCDESGNLLYPTRLIPRSFSCENLARSDSPTYSAIETDGQSMLIAAFPVHTASARGHLALLHDLSFARARAVEAQWYLGVAIFVAGLFILAAAAFVAAVLLREWIAHLRRRISEARLAASGTGDGGPGQGPRTSGPLTMLEDEVRKLMRDLRRSLQPGEAIQVNWSPRTLHLLLEEELPGAEIIAVSNREPYIHQHGANGIELQIPASGLVAALEPVMRACGGTWVAHGSGTADRDTVDRFDRVRVPPDQPAYTLRRVWLSEEEQDGYYYGFANEGLWPLCHISFVRPNFRENDWQMYLDVNRRFADTVAEEAASDNPIILVQDYHFAVLPRMLLERLPRATILTFWHIPWPNAETFGICPWKEEIIHGMLGSTILGFHTQFHCNNFLETVDRYVESRIDREHMSVTLGGHETLVRPYPISIEWPPVAMQNQKPAPECRRAIQERFGLAPDVRIAVGVERFDYTKGVLDRMRAVGELLTHHPEWRERFVFIQAAAPTRSKLETYRSLQQEAFDLARAINEKFGNGDFEPIRLVVRHHEPHEVYELFRAADVCVVSSLHDGMNLVAKEFVAARDDEQGVLVLSSFAGASRELSEALIVNPYDARGVAEAIHQALTMPIEEQRERIHLMRTLVQDRNVYRWAGQILRDAARLRRRQRVLDLVEQSKTTG